MQQQPSNLTTTAQTGSTGYSERQQAAILVNKIFHSLKAIFPAWAAAIRDQDYLNQSKAEWLKGLLENGITADYQIEAGFVKARAHNSPYLPSIGQFIEWCRSATAERYPPFETAYAELMRYISKSAHMRSAHDDLSPFVHHTITHNMDFYNFQQLPIDRLSYEFKIAYKATENEIKAGLPLRIPERHILIEEQPQPPASKESAEAAMSRINSLFEDDDK